MCNGLEYFHVNDVVNVGRNARETAAYYRELQNMTINKIRYSEYKEIVDRFNHWSNNQGAAPNYTFWNFVLGWLF